MKDMQKDEVMAVISAAIYAYGAADGCKVVVRSIKRVPQTAPVWNMTGRIDGIRNKLS